MKKIKKVISVFAAAAFLFSVAACNTHVNIEQEKPEDPATEIVDSEDSGEEETDSTVTDQNTENKEDKPATGNTTNTEGSGEKSDSTDTTDSADQGAQNPSGSEEQVPGDAEAETPADTTPGSTGTTDTPADTTPGSSDKTDTPAEQNPTTPANPSDPTASGTTEDCQVSETDLADWTGRVVLEPEVFANMVSGDYIAIITAPNAGGREPQLKFCLKDADNDVDSTKIGKGGSLSDSTYSTQWLCFTLANANQTSKFYPTDSEIAQLKAKGLMLYGQGVKITAVTLRINASLDVEEEDPGFEDVETPVDTGASLDKARYVHDCGVTGDDLGDAWEWNKSVILGASHFADMESGDFIIITTDVSETSAADAAPVLKLGAYVNYSCQVIGSAESCTNIKEYNSTYNTYNLLSRSQTTRFTPTDEEIALLAANGMVIQGSGVSVTKVTVHITDYLAANPNRDGDSAGGVSSTLCDAQATNNAKRLYNYIKANYGTKVITGQMENAWDNSFKQLDKVYADTGKYPALMGFDFMDYNIDWAIESNFNVQTERAINFWNGKDYKGKKISDSTGIVTFCWHWKDPMKETTNESYKPEELNFRIPYDLASDSWKTTTAEYRAMMRDLDYVAAELLRLQDAGVPVIWRPLHEGAGNVGKYSGGTAWFWWGAGTSKADATDVDKCAEAYIALWKKMYTYFTETKGIHNLIWLWNGQNEKFYPGDAYVDMIGDDIYDKGNYNAQKTDFDRFQAVNPNLPVALSECGTVPSLENMKSQNAMWSFFMVWNDASNTAGGGDNFWNSENYNPLSHKKALYNSSYAITLDDVGDLTKY